MSKNLSDVKKWMAALLCMAILFSLTACGGKEKAGDAEAEDNEVNTIETAIVEIDVLNYGIITVELDGITAPETVANFVSLVNDNFYDGLTFHRIIEGFMIQGGDPKANSTGGSGKTIRGEFAENGVENNISHTRGTISMARNAVDMDSASSQFFIVHQDSTFLDGQYAGFGHVTSGMNVVDAICASAHPTDSNGTIAQSEQPVISSIRVVSES